MTHHYSTFAKQAESCQVHVCVCVSVCVCVCVCVCVRERECTHSCAFFSQSHTHVFTCMLDNENLLCHPDLLN